MWTCQMCAGPTGTLNRASAFPFLDPCQEIVNGKENNLSQEISCLPNSYGLCTQLRDCGSLPANVITPGGPAWLLSVPAYLVNVPFRGREGDVRNLGNHSAHPGDGNTPRYCQCKSPLQHFKQHLVQEWMKTTKALARPWGITRYSQCLLAIKKAVLNSPSLDCISTWTSALRPPPY